MSPPIDRLDVSFDLAFRADWNEVGKRSTLWLGGRGSLRAITIVSSSASVRFSVGSSFATASATVRFPR